MPKGRIRVKRELLNDLLSITFNDHGKEMMQYWIVMNSKGFVLL
jgi:hypothetical protein